MLTSLMPSFLVGKHRRYDPSGRVMIPIEPQYKHSSNTKLANATSPPWGFTGSISISLILGFISEHLLIDYVFSAVDCSQDLNQGYERISLDRFLSWGFDILRHAPIFLYNQKVVRVAEVDLSQLRLILSFLMILAKFCSNSSIILASLRPALFRSP